VAIDRGGERLAGDIEGLAVAQNHLIVSAQNVANPGASWFNVYSLSTGAYLRSVRVRSGTASDDCDQTDGIAATGKVNLFVCQDGRNGTPGTSGNQNFKYVPLDRVLP
jgi:3-phytase